VRISSHFFPSKNPTGVRISSHFFPSKNPTGVRISSHFFPSQTPLEWVSECLEALSFWTPFVSFVCVKKEVYWGLSFLGPFFGAFGSWLHLSNLHLLLYHWGHPSALLCSDLLWSAVVGTTSVLSCYPIN
jgi:hypothetical protein